MYFTIRGITYYAPDEATLITQLLTLDLVTVSEIAAIVARLDARAA